MKLSLFITLFTFLSVIWSCFGGIVYPLERCGGVGTLRELRISDCIGRCTFTPGKVYNCELDFMPSSATPSLTLRVEICMSSGFCHQIVNTVLQGSSVQPGNVYTAKYSIVPNDILSGQEVGFSAFLFHTETNFFEICAGALVDVGEINSLLVNVQNQ